MIGVEPGYSNSDTRIAMAINSATVTIQNLLGRKLSKNTYTEYLDSKNNLLKGYDIYGYGFSPVFFEYKQVSLYIKNYPIDLTEDFFVYYDPNQVFGADTLVDPSCYTLDDEKGILIMKSPVNNYKRSLKIVYTAGYDGTVDTDQGEVFDAMSDPPQEQALANNLPADLFQAAVWQAQLVYEKQYAGNLNVKFSRGEGSTNSVSYVNLHGISPEAMAIIVQNKRYRNYVI